MSNHPPARMTPRSLALASAVLMAAPAGAQSESLLASLRGQRPDATSQARAELDACRAARCPDAGRLGLLAGVLTLADGDAAGAVGLLEASQPPESLTAFHEWYLGQALAWAGRVAEAVPHLERARAQGPAWLAARAKVRLAELWLDLGQPAKARPTFEAAAKARADAQTLLSRGLAREGTGDARGAVDDFTALALRFPTHPHATIALAHRDALKAPALTPAQQFARARALLAAGDSARCLRELDGLTPTGLDAATVALVQGEALLAQQRTGEGLAALDRAEAGAAPVAAGAVMARARHLMRAGDHHRARAAFETVDARWPTTTLADEAGYLAAWLAMRDGDQDEAISAFAAFERRHPASQRRDEARWFRAETMLRAGRYADARALLKTLAGDFPRSSLVPQARYWATRAAQLGAADGTKPVDVVAEYRALAKASPGSYYARLAVERLREAHVRVDPLFARIPSASLEPRMPPALTLAADLARAGLLRDAALETSAVVGHARGSDDAMQWGPWLQQMGDFGAAYTLAVKSLWGAAYGQQEPTALAMLYPRAWRADVVQWSTRHGLDPCFAWAIMRRESAFRPDVTSSADARGLMQLIQPTADGVADAMKSPRVHPVDLYSPDTNIRLATWHLADLFRRLGHPTLVAAAYNGGREAVTSWLDARGDQPLDRWVEEMPWKETRGYVKQVVADALLYRELYDGCGGDGRLPLGLPKRDAPTP